ncbi:hypothetical protein CQW23_18893 [Capsicum baccatum]|uniref:Uncharacterized protein n=1 Tax=Capsicum baccatum TaxID=33114 RepID=A0A2G2W4C7_CAPBA|nr:hypothetical protein CQW23_18893 [Capsicum baccatum]
MSKPKFNSTSSCRSPRIIKNSSPIQLSRPSFNLGCFTLSPLSKGKKIIVESESYNKNQNQCLLDKIEVSFVYEPSKKRNLNKKVEIPQDKRNYKRKNLDSEQVSDSNFEDEIPVLKPKKLKCGGETPSRVTRTKAKVKNAKNVSNKNPQKVCKERKIYSHWASYIKVDFFNDLMLRWKKEHFERFDKKNDFYSDFKSPNKPMSKYYPDIEKVKRSDFYTDFAVTEFFFKKDDLYEIDMIYLIIWFFIPDLSRNYIPKLYFELVESVIAIRSESVMSSRILNWRSSEDLIFNEYLKTTMFKRYSNEADKQFMEVKQYVAKSVKTILNELRSTGIKSDEFNEDRKNDSWSVDNLLQTPHGSKTCEEIPNEPINVKDELSRDMTSEKDGNVTLT